MEGYTRALKSRALRNLKMQRFTRALTSWALRNLKMQRYTQAIKSRSLRNLKMLYTSNMQHKESYKEGELYVAFYGDRSYTTQITRTDLYGVT